MGQTTIKQVFQNASHWKQTKKSGSSSILKMFEELWQPSAICYPWLDIGSKTKAKTKQKTSRRHILGTIGENWVLDGILDKNIMLV